MKFLIILQCVVAIGFAIDVEYMWQDWKATHGKIYSRYAEEEMRRFTWESNLKMVENHNMETRHGFQSFQIEMNAFADMNFKRFGHRQPVNKVQGVCTNSTASFRSGLETLPDTVDWRGKGLVPRVRNQQQMGCSGIISAIESLEGQHAKATGNLVTLSEQNVIDCAQSQFRCLGVDQTFEYIIMNKGIDTEASYPYTGEKGPCNFNPNTIGATMTSCIDVTPSGSELALKTAVAEIGPISVLIDAGHSSFQLYKSGVYSDPDCSSVKLDHAVLVVGYGTKDGKDYWLVQNSWGTAWGMEGYIMMSRNNNNNCGIATAASYPVV